jgi:DNA-binding HxlR family transcriptional regulator
MEQQPWVGTEAVNETPAAEQLSANCPMAGLLEMLTRPWTLHILWLLSHNGPMRFGALKRGAEGISARLLTLRLRTLEAEGFVRRTVREGKVPQVTYAPTLRLTEMNEVLHQLGLLSEKWRQRGAA